MDIETALYLFDRVVCQQTGASLNNLQKAILRGALQGWTYQQIKEQEVSARGYAVSYLAQYVGYELWKLLSNAFNNAGLLKQGEKVRKFNLWEYAERIAQRELLSNLYTA
ncbi:hypothetical protein [Chroococcus sp. FPU101]|uniref:hypothetical protein n=1 Tax=Chroococcus sp. FPU101 TaxID=1974212 RepID=UPI001A8E422A|nr:hypothetical protein [Chroococcus sp. FPU101]GFE70178.1 hypothetical protein CFPU101_27880 [Chroococcus sp. FPU101]